MSKFPPSHKKACGMIPTARIERPRFYNAPSKLAYFSLRRVAWLILECARRTSTFRACAFREQEDDQAAHLYSLTVTVIGIACSGLSNSSRAAATILSTTSMPRKTSPKTV